MRRSLNCDIVAAFKPYTLHPTPRKITPMCDFSCICANFIVPLHRKLGAKGQYWTTLNNVEQYWTAAPRLCRHNKRRHNALCAWHLRTWKILNHPRHCSILMSSGYVYLSPYAPWGCVCVRTYRRGLRCCLFRVKGNSRASKCGTATVQSRFFCVMLWNINTKLICKSHPLFRIYVLG